MKATKVLYALRHRNPVALATLKNDRVQSALDALGTVLVAQSSSEEIPGEQATTKRRTRRVRRSVAISVAGVLVASAAAAGGVLSTQTHQSLPSKYVKVSGPGELLRVWAPNFCQYALSLSKPDHYPAGYSSWRPWVVAFENSISPVTTSGPCPSGRTPRFEVTTGAEKGWFAMSNFCAWVNDWAAATRRGDSSEATRAAGVVRGATRWPAVVAEDPHPYLHKNGLKWSDSTFGFFLTYQREVAAGDVSAVTTSFKSPANHPCTAFVPPPGSHGGTVNPALKRLR